MKNIKAIIFDAYGTLFDVNSAAEKCKDKIGNKWEGFANYWRTTQLEYTWLRSLMNRHKDFWQVTEDSLDKSMQAFNINSSMRNDCFAAASASLDSSAELWSSRGYSSRKTSMQDGSTPTIGVPASINFSRLFKFFAAASRASPSKPLDIIGRPQHSFCCVIWTA